MTGRSHATTGNVGLLPKGPFTMKERDEKLMAQSSNHRPRRSLSRERGTLAHFAGGEGINRDDPGRDDMPPAKSPPSPRYGGGRGFGEESGLGPGRPAPPTDDGERDWRRAMRGQDTSGYGGQYAGLVAGYRGQGPKGYVRRDERIHEDVCERLSREEELDSRDIDVRVGRAW